jgi:hypothetical protein
MTITSPDRVAAALEADRHGQRYALRMAAARLAGEAAVHRADTAAERAYVAGLERAVRVLSEMRDEVAP